MSENGNRSVPAEHAERQAQRKLQTTLAEQAERERLTAQSEHAERQAERERRAARAERAERERETRRAEHAERQAERERQATARSERAEWRAEGEPDAAKPRTSLIDRETAPGLARLAANAGLQTGLWTAEMGYRAAKRLGRAATSPDDAIALVEDTQREVAALGRKLLNIPEEDPEVAETQRDSSNYDDEALRSRWQDLLELSTDVEVDEVDGHPAFADILTQLHPDEARILRLMAAEGAQPAVDVRNWRPLGIGSHVVAPGLNMIGQHAGCLMVDRVPVYLSNLFRLGLIWFSRDAIPDIGAYQVLEAQPEVLDALKRAGRGTTVRRSVQLTPFGEQFCAATLPRTTAEFEAISGVDSRAADEVPRPTEEPKSRVK